MPPPLPAEPPEPLVPPEPAAPPVPPEPLVPLLPPEPLRPADPLLAPEPAEPLLPPEPPVPPLPVAPAMPLVPEAASLPGSVVSDPHAINWDNTNKATLPLMLIIFIPRIYDVRALFEIRLSPTRIERLSIIREVVNHLMGLTLARCPRKGQSLVRSIVTSIENDTDLVSASRNAALRRGLTRAKLATIVSMKARTPKLAKRSFSYDTALETLGARPSFRGKAMVKIHALPRRLRT